MRNTSSTYTRYVYSERKRAIEEQTPENTIITLAQRESAYVEGETAFREGQWRSSNPYATRGLTLEQVWWNGWDRSRKNGKLE